MRQFEVETQGDTDLTVNPLMDSLSDTTISSSPINDELSLVSHLGVFQEFQFIRNEIETFEKTLPQGHCVAITLADYPFYAETRLISITVDHSGLVSISGAAKGNRGIKIVEKLDRLSFALSHIAVTDKANWQKIEVTFSSR